MHDVSSSDFTILEHAFTTKHTVVLEYAVSVHAGCDATFQALRKRLPVDITLQFCIDMNLGGNVYPATNTSWRPIVNRRLCVFSKSGFEDRYLLSDLGNPPASIFIDSFKELGGKYSFSEASRLTTTSWITVNFTTLVDDAKKCYGRTPPGGKIMAVIGKQGFGHGVVLAAKAALGAGFTHIGVHCVRDAQVLRENKIASPILLLYQVPTNEIPQAIALGLELTAETEEFVDSLCKHVAFYSTPETNFTVRVHVNVNTGTGTDGSFEPDVVTKRVQHCAHLEWLGLLPAMAISNNGDFAKYTLNHMNAGAQAIIYASDICDIPHSGDILSECRFCLFGRPKSCYPALNWFTTVSSVKVIPPGKYGNEVIGLASTMAVIPVGGLSTNTFVGINNTLFRVFASNLVSSSFIITVESVKEGDSVLLNGCWQGRTHGPNAQLSELVPRFTVY